MRAIGTLALLVITLTALTGCGGGNNVEMDKTISHEGGILNVGQVVSVAPKLEARSGSGAWADLTNAKERDLENFMQGKSSVEARSYIQFDDAQLALDTKTVTRAGELKDMQNELENRMSAVDKFMKNNNKQLDATGW